MLRTFRLTRYGHTAAEGVRFSNGLTALCWVGVQDHPKDKVLSGSAESLTRLCRDRDLTVIYDDDAEEAREVTCGALALDLDDGKVTLHGRFVGRLAGYPSRALAALMQNPHGVVQMATLVTRLYGEGQSTTGRTNAVQVHLVAVRRVLGPDSIETVRNVGYRLGKIPGLDLAGGEPDAALVEASG